MKKSVHPMQWNLKQQCHIWQRTLSYETPLHFTNFLSDANTVIEKECTNHVAKHLGTALRKMTPLPQGEKLKVTAIQKLQTL